MHSFGIVCLFICSFIVYLFVRSFMRRWPAISFVDIVHELCKVEWYRGGGGSLVWGSALFPMYTLTYSRLDPIYIRKQVLTFC